MNYLKFSRSLIIRLINQNNIGKINNVSVRQITLSKILREEPPKEGKVVKPESYQDFSDLGKTLFFEYKCYFID